MLLFQLCLALTTIDDWRDDNLWRFKLSIDAGYSCHRFQMGSFSKRWERRSILEEKLAKKQAIVGVKLGHATTVMGENQRRRYPHFEPCSGHVSSSARRLFQMGFVTAVAGTVCWTWSHTSQANLDSIGKKKSVHGDDKGVL
jgi:hypothetical protein